MTPSSPHGPRPIGRSSTDLAVSHIATPYWGERRPRRNWNSYNGPTVRSDPSHPSLDAMVRLINSHVVEMAGANPPPIAKSTPLRTLLAPLMAALPHRPPQGARSQRPVRASR